MVQNLCGLWIDEQINEPLPTIKGPNRPICSVRSAPNAEPAPPSCCRPATPKLCSFTSMRSQPKSLRALTLFSSSIKPAGMAPRPSRFQTTSRSYSSRHAHPNSTAKKISGNSCGRTGCRTEFSNPSTISSITAATLGTRSSISRGKSCPSPAAIGQPQVTQSEDWYKLRQKNQITRCKNEGKIRRPNDCLALDQFKNLILSVMKMSRRPEAGRSAIVKNGELPPAVGGANPDARLLAPRCPRHTARRCCSINRDRTRSNSLGRHACSFLLLMRDSLTPVRDL